MLPRTSKTYASALLLPVMLALTTLLMTSCVGQRALFVTGTDYIVLRQGQNYIAPRHMVLATESVIQEKDETILVLLEANAALVAELRYLKTNITVGYSHDL